ncbi:MAG TPA: isoleucine--tRNA ligase [Candidatus Nanoarchaeia archaeon]|nr:isoleucine--tRNA ligase [Candidatus Nanoarchaeia archaeon]
MGIKETELELIKFWNENNIFMKSVESRPKDKQYVFYDGPPFATGTPHYGHILGLTSKDVFPRYWTMKGFRVERRWGWDCHGLPIENIVEKKLGIKDKKEIETMGVDKFNEACRAQVLTFAQEWKKTVDRMGKWIEFDNAYKTMDNSYMESVWWIFKKLYTESYIYEGKKVLLYCPRCQTPLANAEIAMDNSYKTVTEKSATVKFKVKDRSDTFLLSWTTTPWTLVGNVALAVNELLTYVKVKVGPQYLILVKDRLKEVLKGQEYQVVEEFSGKKLLGLEYEPLYDHVVDKKSHYVINGGNDVTAVDGTGMVHMALYGEFDYQMIKKYDLPVIQHVGPHGKIVLGPEKFKDLWFKKADQHVVDDLEERGLLFAADPFTHSYPFCYRCETPLFYNAVDSWFVDIQKVKERLLARNELIHWYPDHMKDGRFRNILETAPDWSISRNRFWATSIPVWKCLDCKEVIVIGSVADLQKLATSKVPDDLDLHKHVVDKIQVTCSKCKKSVSRIPEVLDCWFESGSMPYGAKHYPFENKGWLEKNYPADFISEYVAQVRAWFYYMHVLGVLLLDKPPFKHVVVSGNILAADGAKMSKSKNNYPDPQVIFDQYGADALRFYLMASPLMRAEDLNFKEDGVKEVYRKVVMLLSNVKSFYELFAQHHTSVAKFGGKHVLDRWVVSKSQALVRDVTKAFEAYDTGTACQLLIAFIDELSTWYVRRSRDRFKSSDVQERFDAVHTLGYVLHLLSLVMAPVTPFIAESVYQVLRKSDKSLDESVHVSAWPSWLKNGLDEELNSTMDKVREVVSLALQEREKLKVPVRQPLASIAVTGVVLEKEFLEIVQDELNVKSVVCNSGKEVSVAFDVKLTPALVREGLVRELIRNVNGYRKELQLTLHDRVQLFLDGPDDVKAAVNDFSAELLAAVQADRVDWSLPHEVKVKEVAVGAHQVKLGVLVLKK